MTTARDIVEQAYRKIGVVASDEAMTADQAANGLIALNNMMHGWAVSGVDVLHSDLLSGSEFPLLPRFREGTVYMLAARIAPEYGLGAMDAGEFMRGLQAHYMRIPQMNPAPLSLQSSAHRRTFGVIDANG